MIFGLDTEHCEKGWSFDFSNIVAGYTSQADIDNRSKESDEFNQSRKELKNAYEEKKFLENTYKVSKVVNNILLDAITFTIGISVGYLIAYLLIK
jgi:hypothetical protein